MNSIAILDFGSQYAQIIARRVREAQVYCELFPWDASPEKILSIQPKGFILSGGPKSVYEENAPFIQQFILESGLPILGICYGMQALTHALGGKVDPSAQREYGHAEIQSLISTPLLSALSKVWMSHGDKVTQLPEGFVALAKSGNSPYAAMGDVKRKYFGVQFHPEVHHTPNGIELFKHFAIDICGITPDWTLANIIDDAVEKIRKQVGNERVLAAVSGGVDSSVAAALVHKAIGDQLVCVFVDTGLLRANEGTQVASAFREGLGAELITVDAADDFLGALKGQTDPETKRRIVGEKFIRIFEREAKNVGQPRFLVQGTIYPDVVESSGKDRDKAAKIKSHHNVGGLPEDMQFELVEPLRYLFKDEVRLVGETLGLNQGLVWRQPFPGPGLTVRCLGECTPERLPFELLAKVSSRIVNEVEGINRVVYDITSKPPATIEWE